MHLYNYDLQQQAHNLLALLINTSINDYQTNTHGMASTSTLGFGQLRQDLVLQMQSLLGIKHDATAVPTRPSLDTSVLDVNKRPKHQHHATTSSSSSLTVVTTTQQQQTSLQPPPPLLSLYDLNQDAMIHILSYLASQDHATLERTSVFLNQQVQYYAYESCLVGYDMRVGSVSWSRMMKLSALVWSRCRSGRGLKTVVILF